MATNMIAVVTGATGSLGSSVTKELLSHGIHVIGTYHTEGPLASLRNELGPLVHSIPGQEDGRDERVRSVRTFPMGQA